MHLYYWQAWCLDWRLCFATIFQKFDPKISDFFRSQSMALGSSFFAKKLDFATKMKWFCKKRWKKRKIKRFLRKKQQKQWTYGKKALKLWPNVRSQNQIDPKKSPLKWSHFYTHGLKKQPSSPNIMLANNKIFLHNCISYFPICKLYLCNVMQHWIHPYQQVV